MTDGLAPSSHEDTVVRPAGRSAEQTLARAHLRLGSLSLARVELETLAGRGTLDTDGLADLAEVRWRTGDLAAAGQAAGDVLVAQDAHPLALLIAAEAAAAVGRPGEARRLANRAMEVTTTPIDVLFAGMPRAGIWPADAAEPPPTAGTLFHRETPEATERARIEDGTPAAAVAGVAGGRGRTSGSDAPAPMTIGHSAPMALGFWDGDVETDPATPALPDPAGELEAGRVAYMEGAHEEASLHFGIALRLAPALAPAVLEVTDGARGAGLTMVRGDAYRLVGHEAEAQRAYALAASGGLPERRRRPRPKPVAPASEIEAAPAVEVAEDEHAPIGGAPEAMATDATAEPPPAGDTEGGRDEPPGDVDEPPSDREEASGGREEASGDRQGASDDHDEPLRDDGYTPGDQDEVTDPGPDGDPTA